MPMNSMGTTSWLSLQKCSTVSEKIKMLTCDPCPYRKMKLHSYFQTYITIYVVERAKSLVQEKEVYSELEADTGHPIDEKTEKFVIGY